MNLNEFPSTPYEGQQLLIGNVTYQYAGGVWNVVSAVKTNLRAIAERLAKEAGLNMVDGSFDDGATVTESTDVIWDEFSGKYYAWGGTLPKTVAAGFDPTTNLASNAWIDKSNVTLNSGINGSFTTVDNKTVTIVNGIITNII